MTFRRQDRHINRPLGRDTIDVERFGCTGLMGRWILNCLNPIRLRLCAKRECSPIDWIGVMAANRKPAHRRLKPSGPPELLRSANLNFRPASMLRDRDHVPNDASVFEPRRHAVGRNLEREILASRVGIDLRLVAHARLCDIVFPPEALRHSAFSSGPCIAAEIKLRLAGLPFAPRGTRSPARCGLPSVSIPLPATFNGELKLILTLTLHDASPSLIRSSPLSG